MWLQAVQAGREEHQEESHRLSIKKISVDASPLVYTTRPTCRGVSL